MADWLKKQFDFANETVKSWPNWMQNDINNLLENSTKNTIGFSIPTSSDKQYEQKEEPSEEINNQSMK